MRLPDVNSRKFEVASLAVIVASLVTMTVETLPYLSVGARRVVAMLQIPIVAIFTVEYALRVHSERKYARSAWGVVDALAILPFYLTFVLPWAWEGSQALRTLRLILIFRVMRFGKMGETVNALSVAVRQVRTELCVSIGALLLMMYISSMLVYYAERTAQPEKFESVFHAMWWSVATLTTVGYGDVYPVTLTGKLFAVVTMVFGIGMFGAIAGIMTSVTFRVAEQLKKGSGSDHGE